MASTEPANSPEAPTQPQQTNTYYNFEKLTPKRVKYIMQRADAWGRVDMLYKLYDDMETTDIRYGGILNQLRSTIAGMPLRVQPAEGRTAKERERAEEYAEYASAVLEDLDTQSLTQEFVEPYIRGATLHTIEWELEDLPYNRTMYFPTDVKTIDGRHLVMNDDPVDEHYGEIEMFVEGKGQSVAVSELPDSSTLFLEDGDGRGKYARMGRARNIVPWWIGVRYVSTWWAQYIESYGKPTRVGTYPRGASKKRRAQLKNFLRQVGQDGYGLFPKGMEVELKEAQQKGQMTTYQDYINKAHTEYSINIIGQAGTTGDQEEGGYAKTAILNGIRQDILQHVANLSSKGYEGVVEKGLRLNYGDQYKSHLKPTIQPILLDGQQAKQKAQAAKILSADMGLPVPERHLYEQVLGVEKPQEGERVVVSGEMMEWEGSIEDLPEPLSSQSEASESNNTREADGTGDTSVATNPDQNDTE
jgi:phage gp29-like protein